MVQLTQHEILELLGESFYTGAVRHTAAVISKHRNGEALWSYHTLVAVRLNTALEGCNYFFSGYHDFSRTTSRHVREFCGIDTHSRMRGIDTGKFGYINA